MTFNIGAQFLRVAKNNCGWIFPIETPNHDLEYLKSFLRQIVTPKGWQNFIESGEYSEF